MNNRIDKINEYKERKDKERQLKESRIKNDKLSLIKQIRCFAADIKELIETATVCVRAGIDLNPYKRYGREYDTYEKGTFVTNPISHRLGFYELSDEIVGIGFRNGGACGNVDFFVDIMGKVHAINSDTFSKNYGSELDVMNIRLDHLKAFKKIFETFKISFHKYVDSFLEEETKHFVGEFFESSVGTDGSDTEPKKQIQLKPVSETRLPLNVLSKNSVAFLEKAADNAVSVPLEASRITQKVHNKVVTIGYLVYPFKFDNDIGSEIPADLQEIIEAAIKNDVVTIIFDRDE